MAYINDKPVSLVKASAGRSAPKIGFGAKALRDWKLNKSLYFIILPVIIFYVMFAYKPMYGAMIAFKDFSPRLGILGSEWVGLKYFEQFFGSPYFSRILRNTLWISFCSIVFSFPMPIILALLVNELKNKAFSSAVKTISYLPHFISLVVVCSMVKEFTSDTGVINDFLSLFGAQRTTMLINPKLFVPVYIVSDIWQGVGWGSIIYLAALSGISQDLYEAARIDGAGKWKQMLHVTIPGIMPTVITMLILRIGNVMNVGFEKIILLYNSITYETADVISSFVFRKGIVEQNYSFSTAVGLFNSVINCIFIIAANTVCNKLGENSLW